VSGTIFYIFRKAATKWFLFEVSEVRNEEVTLEIKQMGQLWAVT
jgi:hypothetical protein